MRNRSILLVAILVVAAAMVPGAVAAQPAADATQTTDQPDCTYPVTLTDVTGTEVTIEEPPETVVAAQASDAQMLTELDVGESLIGMPVGPYTDHLEVPDDVTDISEDDGITPVAETIIDLDADVVIAANTVLFVDGFVEQLREADQTVYVYDSAASLEEIESNVQLAGTLANECESAEATVDEMNEQLDVIDDVVAESEERPLAYYVMGEDELTTAGTGTFQHEMLERAGVENIAERDGIQGWGEISEEVVIEEDPEWLIYGDALDEPPAMTATEATTAWDQEQFVVVDSNAMAQPGPHVVDAIEEIAATVHPEAYAEVTGEASAGDADDVASDDERSDETAIDEIPGFGVSAAIAAIVATLLLGRRAA